MREGYISDGTCLLEITFWGDLVDMVEEDVLLQFCFTSAKAYQDELVLSINYVF